MGIMQSLTLKRSIIAFRFRKEHESIQNFHYIINAQKLENFDLLLQEFYCALMNFHCFVISFCAMIVVVRLYFIVILFSRHLNFA